MFSRFVSEIQWLVVLVFILEKMVNTWCKNVLVVGDARGYKVGDANSRCGDAREMWLNEREGEVVSKMAGH